MMNCRFFFFRYAGLSLLWPLPLRSTGSGRADPAAMAHGPSRSAVCGIFPDRGTNPRPLHRQADSQPLRHQGSLGPRFCIEILPGASLVARWLGVQGSCPGPGRSHMPRSTWAREPWPLSLRVRRLCSATGEATTVRGPQKTYQEVWCSFGGHFNFLFSP